MWIQHELFPNIILTRFSSLLVLDLKNSNIRRDILRNVHPLLELSTFNWPHELIADNAIIRSMIALSYSIRHNDLTRTVA